MALCLKGMTIMKKRLMSVLLAAVLSAGLFSSPAQELLQSTSAVAEAATTVSAPVPSRKAGTYSASSSISVKLTTSTSGAKIYYSTGSSYKLYSGKLKFTKNTTLKCYSVKNGVKSSVKTYKYKLVPKVTVSEDEGAYDEPICVELGTKTSGTTLYYTLDGSKPTTKSDVYEDPIDIDTTTTLRVLAIKSGWTKKYFTYEYDIEIEDADEYTDEEDYDYDIDDEDEDDTSSDSSSLSSESILGNYEVKYAYSTLTSAQKKAYARLFEGVSEHSSKISLSDLNLSSSDLSIAYTALCYDNAQFFWLDHSYTYYTNTSWYSGSYGSVDSISINYSRTAAEVKNIKPKLEAAAKKIVDEALEKDSLFERVLYIHDSITESTVYTLTGGSYISQSDGPLVYGYALCEGYSKAFMYLCQSVGIECVCVGGEASGGPHMWNMLKLDGEWYNMDVTWDDDTGYNYFCITTSQISKDHTFKNEFTVPKATATKYSYFEAMGIEVYSNAADAYNALVKEAAKNWKNGVTSTTIYLESGVVNSLRSKVNSSSFFSDLAAKGCNASSWSAEFNDTYFTLKLY